MTDVELIRSEFLTLSDALKHRRGDEFETHDHPAVIFDRATGPTVRVWGWWTRTTPRVPCLLWSSERGWSATAVEPTEIDGPGYELPHWSHRIRLLDTALANSVGPHLTLALLELYIASDSTLPLGPLGAPIPEALQWGIAGLRSARAHPHNLHAVGTTLATSGPNTPAGTVDAELVRHALVPTLAKPIQGKATSKTRKQKDAGLGALVDALAQTRRQPGVDAEAKTRRGLSPRLT